MCLVSGGKAVPYFQTSRSFHVCLHSPLTCAHRVHRYARSTFPFHSCQNQSFVSPAMNVYWDTICRRYPFANVPPEVLPSWPRVSLRESSRDFFDPAHELPAAFFDDFLSIVSDETRHFASVRARLQNLGSDYGALPAHRHLWQQSVLSR